MKKLIIIPTYNEKKNIVILLNKIIKLYNSRFQILVIDDNSPDGTSDTVKQYNKKYKFIKLKKRKKKLGVGSAHKYGIKYAVKNKFKILITMDADGTHNPSYIKKFLFYIQKYDLITTNRFLNKKSIQAWPISRIIFTNLRHFIIKLFLGVPIDSSGAFRCYNLNKLKFRDILKAKDNGYSFFWESMFIIYKKNYSIKEIPIYLPYRTIGSSKMKLKDIFSALIYLIYISLKNKNN